MKKFLPRILVGLAIVAVFFLHERGDFELPFVRKLENVVYDARLRVTMPGGVDQQVVILDIDEKSLKERENGGEGRWPWPRDRLALLVDKLFDKYQIEVLGFDIVFAERDQTSGSQVLDQLARKDLAGVVPFQNAYAKLRPQLDFDAIFAEKLKKRKVVMGYTFHDGENTEKKGLLPAPVFSATDLGSHKIANQQVRTGYSANLEILQKSAASGGHFNPANDLVDGVLRKVQLVIPFEKQYYATLSLAMVRSYFDNPPVKLEFADYTSGDAELEEISVAGLKIPVDNQGRALIPFRGARGSFRYVSAADVINERVDAGALKGKLVLMGTSAPGLLDLRVTPMDAVYPGVEAHANLIAGMLDGTIKRNPAYAEGAQLIVVMLLGLVLAMVLPMLSVLSATIVTSLLLATAIGVNLALYQHANFVLPVAGSVLMITLLFAFNTVWGYFTETRNKKQITGFFGQYVPPEIAEEMSESMDLTVFEPASKECTILFTDVRGFTTISEGLEPKALSDLMNNFLTPLTKVIYSHRGTIDKYMGDCIMAFWGAPVANPNHAHTAVVAALAMHNKLKELQTEFKSKNWPEIKIGIGLNTGRVSVGNMGSELRLAYTVMGDAVNLASRLEGITKEYGADIIVGENTVAAAPDIIFRELDRVRVKGKEQAVSIFQPIGPKTEISEDTIKRLGVFQAALTAYRKQDWDSAEAQLQHLHETSPENKLYMMFLERIPVLREKNLGPDWDGAFTFETK